ncbi:porin [Cupriavidus basilensis]
MGGYRWRDSRYGNGVTAIRDNVYWAGMSYSMTAAMKLIAGYYYDQVLGASLSPNTKAASLPNFSQFSLMGAYSLSKRTTVYLVSAYAHNGPVDYDTLLQTGASYGYGNPTTLNGLANGQKSQVAVAAGLRVIFLIGRRRSAPDRTPLDRGHAIHFRAPDRRRIRGMFALTHHTENQMPKFLFVQSSTRGAASVSGQLAASLKEQLDVIPGNEILERNLGGNPLPVLDGAFA